MKERPIIFSAPMIRAILDGKKTQTRRIVKDARVTTIEVVPSLLAHRGDLWDLRRDLDNPVAIRCPYGVSGDRLWVREAFCVDGDVVFYRATHSSYEDDPGSGWTSPLFMPRWASRITLELTDVRVQRVQDISEDDACAEGVDGPHYGRWTDMTGAVVPPLSEPARPWAHSFAVAWREVHRGDDASWFTNPWVWALTFKRVEQPR